MPTIEEEMEIEECIKDQGHQFSSMLEILSQILAMLKEKDAPESSKRQKAKGKEVRGEIPASPAHPEGKKSEEEDGVE
ncbi:unnamed protein product [Linum trigynum]|uniref:Uncharacterized protein n=1 Tax=Linum trigynum TaxID=586398 RepID=A0AAV2GBK6_9ROSI